MRHLRQKKILAPVGTTANCANNTARNEKHIKYNSIRFVCLVKREWEMCVGILCLISTFFLILLPRLIPLI